MKFHYEILSKKQKETLSFIDSFKNEFFLVWWTAIALMLWHRKSIDFDLFIPNSESLPMRKISTILKNHDYKIITKTDFHYEIFLNWVKITFFAYLYNIPDQRKIQWDYFKTIDLLHLSSMKADALWKRAKWKDYVDLYFLIKKLWLKTIWDYAKSFFKWIFNEKLFYSQLSYFNDIDYSEEVMFVNKYEVTKDEIKEFLTNESKTILFND